MRIQPQHLTLSDLLAKRLFRIPEYQRCYSWERKQRQDLFQDIKALRGGEEDSTHFMATMVGLRRERKRISTDDFQLVEIVDGQQRLTTLIILYKAIEMALDQKRTEHKKLKEEIDSLLVKSDEHSLLLLQTNHDSSNYYVDFIRKGKIEDPKNAKSLADRAILEAILDCTEFVKDWNLIELAAILKNKLTFILHEIEDEAAVYTVFEVLNSRGLDVAWLDRLKSILMATACAVPEGKNMELLHELHECWKKIYKSIGLIQGRGSEALRFAATLWLNSNGGLSKVLSEADSVDLFKTSISGHPKEALDISRWILKTVESLDKLLGNKSRAAVTKISHARLLAVAILLRDDLKDQEALLGKWERVTFRIFGMCGKDARTKVGDYVRLAQAILQKKLKSSEIGTQVLELGSEDVYSVKQAVTTLRDKDCYQGWEEELRYLLFRYEEHLSTQARQKFKNEQWERIWEKSASKSIEHIQPQSKGSQIPDAKKIFVHRLGNLMLLPPGLNSSIGDKLPKAKRDDYEKTGMLIAREVLEDLPSWNRESVIKREELILDWITKEWK